MPTPTGHWAGPQRLAPCRPRPGRVVPLALVAALILGCSSGDDTLGVDDATECRELGGELVYIRYESADGDVEIRIQPGIRDDQAQASSGLSQDARAVLQARGWDEDALGELQRGEPLSADVAARLDAAPSCLDRLRDTASS